MKTLAYASVVLAALVILSQPLRSQVVRKTAREELQAFKAANQKLIEQQTKTLEKMDQTQKEASQLRTFVRRT